MKLTRRRLNRTLLRRQRLLSRVAAEPRELVDHLVGLQAQEPMPPYLSLAARLTDVDPYAVSAMIEDARLVRLVTLRSTVHLHLPEDAVALRAWTQQVTEREIRGAQHLAPARDIDRAAFAAALADALADGPLPQRTLGEALTAAFPGLPARVLGGLARCAAPLCQLPPRGCWGRSGGVVYDDVYRWTGLTPVEPDEAGVSRVVRRYLRAYGPASASDVTTWSGVTRLQPVLKAMPDLVTYEDEEGRVLYDVAGGELADGDEPAPVRLLGTYDNVFLSHAGRDRVTDLEVRRRWMTREGKIGQLLFADGWLAGLWWVTDGRVDVERFRPFSRTERAGLRDEIDRVEQLFASGG